MLERLRILKKKYYYYSFYLQSDAVPLWVHTDCLLLQGKSSRAHLEAKTLRMYRKSTLPKTNPKADPKASPKARENLYLIIYPPWVSVQGFTYLCFTNISTRYNVIEVPVLSALLYIRFLTPFLSFIYHLVYIAPFSLSIAKDYKGVSSTSFKYLF